MPYGIAAGVIGAGGSILGGLLGSSGAQRAANQQVQAANNATKVQEVEFNQINQREQPFVDAGNLSLQNLLNALGIQSNGAGGFGQLTTPYGGGSPVDVTAGYSQALGNLIPPQYTPYGGFSMTAGQTGLPGSSNVPGAPTVGSVGPNGIGVPTFNAPKPFSYNPQDIAKDPAYLFSLQQGEDAARNNASALGGAFSGNTLKALDKFATGTAQQYYGQDEGIAANQYGLNFNTGLTTFQNNLQNNLTGYGTNRDTYNLNFANSLAGNQNQFNQIEQQFNNALGVQQLGFNQNQSQQNQLFNYLNALVAGGQNAVGGQANAGTNFANSVSNLLTGAGAANAGGIVGSTNSIIGGLNGLGNNLGSLLMQYGAGGFGGGGGAMAGGVTNSIMPTNLINAQPQNSDEASYIQQYYNGLGNQYGGGSQVAGI